MDKTLILKGLNCANCAAKIEHTVDSLQEVNEASLNFNTSSLSINFDNTVDSNKLLSKVEQIVNSIESDVIVIDKDNISKDSNTIEKNNRTLEIDESLNKKDILKLIIGIGFFISALIFNANFNVKVILYIISYLLIGGDIILKAIKNISNGQVFDENFLMVIATIGAFSIQEFAEAVGVMLFYKIGEAFQDIAVDRSRKSIADLMDIKPLYANLKLENSIKKVSPEEINVGDIIVVKPGEKIPLDGIIIDGESTVDTSALTGESLPKRVKSDDNVLSGFINKNGVLTIKTNKTFENSTVSKILDLVENAGSKKAKTEKFITKFARYYTPIVVFSALALAIIPPLLLPNAQFYTWFRRALIFLVVSCPCALVISIPLGFFAGIGSASRHGILIKGGNYLEALNKLETIVFDKTGTLTKGVFEVSEIHSNANISDEELLKIAAHAEIYSNHPIANSVLNAYGKDIDKSSIKSYTEIAGHGITAMIDDKIVLVGNSKLMEKYRINFTKYDSTATIIYIAEEDKYLGYILIEDKLKEDSKQAIEDIKNLGVRQTVMLTGDTKKSAEINAKKLNIDKVYSELLPQNKVEIVEEIISEKEYGNIAFVGDGINDAPVLARADVGIAMGGVGSDAAIEAADVVLMTDEPSKIVEAIKISKFTRKIISQNIVFALTIKLLVLLLGAFGQATMWEAVFADVGVALLAVLNASRIIRYNVKLK